MTSFQRSCVVVKMYSPLRRRFVLDFGKQTAAWRRLQWPDCSANEMKWNKDILAWIRRLLCGSLSREKINQDNEADFFAPGIDINQCVLSSLQVIDSIFLLPIFRKAQPSFFRVLHTMIRLRPWRRKAVPSEILVKEIHFPDSKISLASFVSARIEIPLYIKFSQEKKNEDRNFTSRS